MARTEVTREQFKASKDELSGTVKVTHIPTGAWFTSSHENIGQAGDVLENGDDCKIACNNDPLRGWFRVE